MRRSKDWCSYIPEMQGKANWEIKRFVLRVVKYKLYMLRNNYTEIKELRNKVNVYVR
jgi:hypothetical protein